MKGEQSFLVSQLKMHVYVIRKKWPGEMQASIRQGARAQGMRWSW